MSAAGPRRLDRGWFWIAVLTALLAIAAGAAIAFLGYTNDAGPAATVRDYFTALARADAPDALALGDIPDGPRTLLTSDVLAEQQRLAPIRDVTVVTSNQRGAQATVTVSYRLAFPEGAQQVTDTVPLAQRDGRWWLARVAVSTDLRLLQAGDRAAILGAPLPDGDTLLFPGAVPVTFDSRYLELTPATAAVGFAAGSETDLDVQVSPAGRKAVVAAVTRQLDRCLQPGADPRCPLPSDRYVPGSLRGSVPDDLGDGLTLTVPATARGAINVSGDVRFTGSWRSLTFENVAQPHSGGLQLPVAATTDVTTPLRVIWQETS